MTERGADGAITIGGTRLKAAVTVLLTASSTVQTPVPEHPEPDQPVKVEPAEGVAASVTDVPAANGAKHVVPQAMPAGLLDTEPDPAPALVTVKVFGLATKLAVTAASLVMVTTQMDVPEQPAPDQPLKADPGAGLAERMTSVFCGKACSHVTPQSMPAGELVSAPVPDPLRVTVRVRGTRSNVAVTVALAVRVTEQVAPDVLVHPVQLLNDEPAAGTAVSVRAVLAGNVEEQVAPQLIPTGVEVTVPEPRPALRTVATGSGVTLTSTVAVWPAAANKLTEQDGRPSWMTPIEPAPVQLGLPVGLGLTGP